MFGMILGILFSIILLWFFRNSFYAKRLTEMKDEKAVEKIISNKNIAKSGLIVAYIFPTALFIFSMLIYFIFG